MIISIEAMHLLPHPFGGAGASSSSQSRLWERQHSSSQLSFGFSESLPHLLPRQAFFVLATEIPERAWNGRLEMAPSSSGRFLRPTPICFGALAALRRLKRDRTKLLTPNLSYNYLTGRIPPHRKTPDEPRATTLTTTKLKEN
ncbi:hypothetical protein [Rhizobium lentis]|uniref:hypothetical protein n=1 Tax=Rhizobium lentis TaxID=1138194 RepID=UPI001A90D583|nr:hypothetical protein [Rhizobium lentis]MBX5050690.1 hypothetical protein [Rhizobium lentis]MBX5062704.1 hypothetical protein [Rhizobium lentis]MBX5064856.1 hypothetical protein [Rhizobium lentis]MBX5077320.1 hypothetical protein [Rhizobium lentis]MBX5100829.1 hypothetical protein [Rhizobium lentis]